MGRATRRHSGLDRVRRGLARRFDRRVVATIDLARWQRRNRRVRPFRAHLDPAATHGTSVLVVAELVATGLATEVPASSADIVFCDPDAAPRWAQVRAETDATFWINQLDAVAAHLDDKVAFARLTASLDSALETHVETSDTHLSGMWVEKPIGGSGGAGISVRRDPGRWNRPGHLLQRYVEDPLCVDGHKIGVRVLARIGDDGSLVVADDARLTMTPKTFDPASDDMGRHISNVLLFDDGTDEPFDGLLSDRPELLDLVDPIRTVIAEHVAALDDLGVFGGGHDFEIYGYDFVVSGDRRPYPVECNRFPGLYLWDDRRRYYRPAMQKFFTRR